MFHWIKSIALQARSALVVRIFLVVALSVVVPAALLLTAALALFENVVQDSIASELGTALDGAERDLTSFLADLTAVSGSLADNPEIIRIFTTDMTPYDRTKALDRAVDGLFMALPGRDAVRWTFLTDKGIYSSWSRNFNDYGFLEQSPLALRAKELGGHVAWEGFNPSFMMEEKKWSLLISAARQFPADPYASIKNKNERLGTLILSAETEAFRKYLKDKRASERFATLVIAKQGTVLVDATNELIPSDVSELVASSFGRNADTKEVYRRIGGYLMAGRMLRALPAELADQDWAIAVLYSYGDLSRRFDKLRAYFLPGSSLLLATALIVSFFISRRVVRPITRLSKTMESWRPGVKGEDTTEISIKAPSMDVVRTDEIGVLNRSFGRLQEDIESLLERLKREHEIRELYRYRSLRAQLNPHFLFNSLNSVRWLAIMKKADNIVAAIDDLSGLLVYSMGKGGDACTLEEELQSVEQYLAVQNLRYGGRFKLSKKVPNDLLNTEALRFMLQPLVENCVMHGYQGASAEGLIEIEAAENKNILTVTVSDRGTGVDPVALELKLEEEPERDGGLGLNNVRDMLALTYGSTANLTLFARDGGGAVVRLRLPLKRAI